MVWQASTRAKSPGSWITRSTSSVYANRTNCSFGSRSTNPSAEETEEGLDRQSIQLAREGAPLPYSSPEADWFGQGPVELNQTLCRSVQHPEKTHKLWSEAKCLQSAQKAPVVHPIECLLLI
ncbi:unnamed protein product [Caretta caretta]